MFFLLLLASLVASGCYGPAGTSRGDDDDNGDDDDDDTDDDDDDTTDDDDATDDDDTTDDDDVVEPFEISEIDPDHALTSPPSDEDQAEIFYKGSLDGVDEDEVEVHFGGQQAEVLAITSEKLLVEIPPGCEPGEVDVDVETPNGDDSVDFEYDPAGEGLDGAVFGVYRSEIPAYPGNESGAVELGLFEPEDSPPLTHLPPLGNCSPNIVPPANTRDYYDVGASITITAGVPIVATLDPATTTYTASGVTASAVPNSSSYTVYNAIDPDGCSLPLEAVVSAPPAFTISSPLITSTELADCWFIDGGYGVIEWAGPYDSGDFVFVTLTNSEDASAPSITCHNQDIGSMVLNEADLIYLQPGLHQISVTRYRVTETDHPRDGSTMHGVFADTESGFVFVELFASSCGF